MKTGGAILVERGHRLHMCRVENEVGVGHPDVEGCLDAYQFWLELKSEKRPARPATTIKPKTRPAQKVWHEARAKAGSRTHFVLLQVGEASTAKLYLVPGIWYDMVHVTEASLRDLSIVEPTTPMPEVLITAARGW